jgi:transmembrane protein 33
LILCLVRYSFSWLRMHSYTATAKFSYRTAFIAAALTYGIVVYKTIRARARAKQAPASMITLITDENVQYLRMHAVVCFESCQFS